MSIPSYRGVVRGGAVVLDGDVDLPDGTGVVVILDPGGAGRAEAVLAAAKAPPHVSPEDTAAFLRGIEEGSAKSGKEWVEQERVGGVGRAAKMGGVCWSRVHRCASVVA